MRSGLRAHFLSAVVGGFVVAGALLASGITGHGATRTVIEQVPMAAERASTGAAGLTPHAIYVRDAPGVVFVRAQVVQTVQDPFDLYAQPQPRESTGSGFVIDARGDILTNYHVIEGADPSTGVTVQFEDHVSRSARVVGQDQNNDLAVLRVDIAGVNLSPLALGDSSTVQVGDPTLAIGNPFGLDRTLTSGLVSALQRQIQAPNGFSIDNVIQTDAPINPGNSGGPLIDAAGRVIGINSQIATGANGNGSVGIGFAIPIDTAEKVLPQLERGHQVRIAYLGVSGTPAIGPQPGVVVQRAVSGGPAADAGLRGGDSIVAIDGRTISTMQEVRHIVASRQPGQTVIVRVARGQSHHRIRVRLGARPPEAPAQ